MSVSCIHQGSEMGVFDRAVPLFNKALILVRVSECCMHCMTSVQQQARERVVNRTAGLGGAREDKAKGNGWCSV